MRPSLTQVSGAVALAAGIHQALTGIRGVAGTEPAVTTLEPRVKASLDSELRFYGTWYAAAGLFALRQPERAALGPVWLACAAARIAGMRALGRPHPVFLALTAAEAAVGTALIAGSARAARQQQPLHPAP